MEEGLYTLVFIVLLVLMSIMDAVGRRRQRQRRMEEMEREEAEQGAEESSARTPSDPRPHTEEPAGDRPRDPVPGSLPQTVGGSGEPAGERETADQMVPEDFWAILTGQAPAKPESPQRAEGRTEPRDVHREAPVGKSRTADAYRSAGHVEHSEDRSIRREPDEFGRRGDPDPPKDPHIPFPLPGDRISTKDEAPRDMTESAPRPTRRSARWMEGVGGREEPDRTVPPIDADEAAIYGTMQEPWGELGDIAAGDLMEDDPKKPVARKGKPGPPRGRRGGKEGTTYTRLLHTGDTEDLRKAIVLREVLGPPVGLRDEDGSGR